MGQPDFVSHVKNLRVSIDIEFLTAYVRFYISGEIFLPDPEGHFAATFAINLRLALAEVIHDLFPQG